MLSTGPGFLSQALLEYSDKLAQERKQTSQPVSKQNFRGMISTQGGRVVGNADFNSTVSVHAAVEVEAEVKFQEPTPRVAIPVALIDNFVYTEVNFFHVEGSSWHGWDAILCLVRFPSVVCFYSC